MNALIKVALFIVAANVVTNLVKPGTKKPSIIKRAAKNIINKEEVKTSDAINNTSSIKDMK